jgi:hypothetical protein
MAAATLSSALTGLALLLLPLLCGWPTPAAAQDASKMPGYLQDLDRAYRSGDWVLQCDSSRICRIVGVVKMSGRGTDMRAIVSVSRGIEKNARYYVRFAFIDDNGFVLPKCRRHWHCIWARLRVMRNIRSTG